MKLQTEQKTMKGSLNKITKGINYQDWIAPPSISSPVRTRTLSLQMNPI